MGPAKKRIRQPSTTKFKCRTCGKSLTTRASLKLHERIHTGEKPYACVLCDKTFTLLNYLTRHTRYHTGEKPFACDWPNCQRAFVDASDLKCHSVTHLPVRPFKCIECPKTYKDPTSLSSHRRKIHGPTANLKPYHCTIPECSKAFKTRQSLKLHIIRHSGSKNFVCTLCDQRHYTAGDLVQHHKQTHAEKVHICTICQKGFAKSNILRRHEQTHSTEASLKCDLCDKTFRLSSSLYRHRLGHTDRAKTIPCEFCDRKFTFRSDLNNHIRSHTGEKPFACPHAGTGAGCDRTFATKSHAIMHGKTHQSGDKNRYSCATCGKTFAGKGNLTQHTRTHTGEKPYSCDACSKRFTSSTALRRHLLSHLGEKPHVCSDCGRRFTTISNLRTHFKRQHTAEGAARRECEICHMSVKASVLKRHLQTHGRRERVFTCEICSSSFHTAGTLKLHQVIHGPKQHTCGLCNKSFHTSLSLRRHIHGHTKE